MRNILVCKGCEHLKRFSSRCEENIKGCALDHKFKAEDKKECWTQYSNECPLRKYSGKGEVGNNPIIYTWEE